VLRSVAVDISRTSFARGIFSRTIRTTAVIVRLDRTIQYSETVTIEPMGRGVLDRPLSRAMTAEYGVRAVPRRRREILLRSRPRKPKESTMSWQPSNDPVLGDPMSCDALDLVIVPRTRDLGDGFAVRRALPHGKRQMVGPLLFFDHFGPVQFVSGKGMDVRPHPHIGLATVTYLFDGAIMHRDSEGNIQEIQPGAMNLMTAGRGIAHSERTPDVQRASGQKMLGLQSWIALPAGSEEIAPSFQHYGAGDLPMVSERDFTAKVIAGSSFGVTSPVSMVSPWFYTEVTAVAGATVPLDPDHEERAIYVVDGEVEIANERYEGPRLLIFRPGDRITVKALKATRMMFLGGDALEGPRHIWWNFVSSSKERIEQAKQDWKTGRFAAVPQEHEFIPLPE
jgi:redox-sensitive bicupin YhaK (pirin superfamily)